MEILDVGHRYALRAFDGHSVQTLTFSKRVGPGYPGNEGEPYEGTNCQEVLLALINRVKYLDNQKPCNENRVILGLLRGALTLFELRAARRKGAEIKFVRELEDAEYRSTNPDGHWDQTEKETS